MHRTIEVPCILNQGMILQRADKGGILPSYIINQAMTQSFHSGPTFHNPGFVIIVPKLD